ncbi:unnamed protein product [Dicrocoelium dendriticum]|nr:unnamed protein product [Dicrocoelium dendriticum]
MSSSPQHPAFYPSRRQLWTNTTGVQPGWCSRFLHRSGLGSNCGSLHAAWAAFFTAFSTLWLVINAVSRYCAFKSQAYDPRFGSQWDETVTLNTQLIAIIIALALLPVMFYSAISRTGHLANDSILLGRDIVHLQKRLFACAYFRQLWKSAFNNSAGLVNVSHEEGSPHEEEALETLLVKRKGHNFYASLIHTFRPYSAIIYVLIVYCLLFPVSILEAEQIRNEAIHPRK